MAIFRLMQCRLTLFDLHLDPCINYQYKLAKILYRTFSKDVRLANIDDLKQKYNPYPDERSPPQEDLQSIYTGFIALMADELIVEEQDKRPYRIKSSGEFWPDCISIQTHDAFEKLNYLLTDFHPAKRPVFWRILITPAYIYRAIMEAAEDPEEMKHHLNLDKKSPQNIKERIKKWIPETDRGDLL
jgi:hypothetical protein